ncbi:MAG: Holliday junction resolvase RuvX [Bacteroidota bacterium]
MPRILAIDYGKKRTGLAWSDPNQIIASALETVGTEDLQAYVKSLFDREEIETIVLGMPTKLDGSDTDITAEVRLFEAHLKQAYPQVKIELWDERFTSKMAMQALISSGMSKKKRRNKGEIDKMAATIMLQEYMGL